MKNLRTRLGLILLVSSSILFFQVGHSGSVDEHTVNLPFITKDLLLTGSVKGQVIVAGFDLPIPDITVCALNLELCTTTDSDGLYELSGVPVGERTFQASGSGVFPQEQSTQIWRDQTSVLDFAMSRSATVGQIQIILTWETRQDLDAHLWLPPTTPFHVYWQTIGDLTIFPFAQLDGDAIHSFGPETITISQGIPGNYTYGVYKFSDAGELPWFNPEVQVIDELGLVVEYEVPTTGEGRWWYVFDWLYFDPELDLGNITTKNVLSRTSPGPYDPTPFGPASSHPFWKHSRTPIHP